MKMDIIWDWVNKEGNEKFRDNFDKYYWKGRMRRHNAWRNFGVWFITKFTWAVIKRSNAWTRNVEHRGEVPNIKKLDELKRSKCWHEPGKESVTYFKYELQMAEYRYMGMTEMECLLDALYHTLLRPNSTPFCRKAGPSKKLNDMYEEYTYGKDDEDETC